MHVPRDASSPAPHIEGVEVPVGEIAFTDAGILATPPLESAVVVCLWEAERRMVGLLHFGFPSASCASEGGERRALDADTGIDLLVSTLCDAGADRRQVRARLIGGSRPAGTDEDAMGPRNLVAARRRLWAQRIMLVAEDVGGQLVRTVRMRALDGRVLVTCPDRADVVL